MSTPASTVPQGQRLEPWSLRRLIARHKLATLVVAGLCALMVVPFVLVALGSKGATVTDATNCTQWGSSNQSLQSAYARLYLTEHGPVPHWGSSPADVINAINWGCGIAYGDDVADTTTVQQAITGNY